jgi:hypothetical protein
MTTSVENLNIVAKIEESGVFNLPLDEMNATKRKLAENQYIDHKAALMALEHHGYAVLSLRIEKDQISPISELIFNRSISAEEVSFNENDIFISANVFSKLNDFNLDVEDLSPARLPAISDISVRQMYANSIQTQSALEFLTEKTQKKRKVQPTV